MLLKLARGSDVSLFFLKEEKEENDEEEEEKKHSASNSLAGHSCARDA